MDIKINIEEGKIIVSASLSLYDPRSNPRCSIDTTMIENHLREKEIDFGKCIKSSSLSNGDKDYLTGTWIFECFENKIEKPLDKPAENVILSKEEKPASKNKSSAKKKTSK
tara:strand:+ start:355 stop:687 length:333 start_codon:yes stop_codon:yes gene_type:complete